MSISPPASPLLGEVGKLITDDAKEYIDRIIGLADGKLAEHPSVRTPGSRVLSPARRLAGMQGGEARQSSQARLEFEGLRADSEDAARRDAEHLTPAQLIPREAQTPGQALTPSLRIYARAPKQCSIENIINRALGTPGGIVDCYETTESASEKLQSAKDRETGIDHAELLVNCEQQFKDALPMAIERLFELAAGITVQRTRYGRPYTITCKPNCRAIEYIADRVAGVGTSVIGELKTKFRNPNLDREFTKEDIDAMTQAERNALRDALIRKMATEPDEELDDEDEDNPPSNSPPSPVNGEKCNSFGDPQASTSPPSTTCSNASLTSNSHPSTVYGRGDGGEGYKGDVFAGEGEGYKAGADGQTPDNTLEQPNALPAYAITANKQLTDFLPTAINHMKKLAAGAETVIETEVERMVVKLDPDLRANTFLINRFMGAPTRYVADERIVEQTEYDKTIESLAARYPDVIAHYGSAKAAIAAYYARAGSL